jgi:DNA end-binding protein Ku
MKPIWHGTVSFGLVSIPVNLYSAINTETYDFDMLHAKCHHHITYERWCPHCKKKVPWQSIVKGIKKADGSYFIITKENLEALKPTKTDSISIVEFVPASEINPLYLEKHYYLAPKKTDEKAFFLFKQALATTDKVAIGQFVMRNKEYVCAITPYKDAFILNTLNYAYEIRDMKNIKELQKIPKVNTAELSLAKELIKKLTKKKFDLSKFKDTFIQQLKKAIASAKKTKKGRATKIKVTRKPKKEKALVSMLKQSLKKPSRSKPTGATAYAKKK